MADDPEINLQPLTLVLFAGAFDRVHYALAMAAAALAIDRPVTLFFTMGALHALRAPDAGGPGWHHLASGENGLPPEPADRALTDARLGGFEELLSACAALGGQVMVCEMGMRAVGLTMADLRDDIAFTPGGLATLLADTPAGPMMFI